MKTIVYIDGYNLYYGALRGTAYKWLDVMTLFASICHIQNPASEVIAIRFFTAPIKSKLATHGDLSLKSQSDYHRALQVLYPNRLEIVLGYFSLAEGWFPKYQTPTLRAIRADFPNITVGAVMPRLKPIEKSTRPYSTELAELAHWTRGHILEEELQAAQLPALIPTNRKPILKPTYW